MSRLAGFTPADKSILSLSGSSQQLVAADETRVYLFIQNTGNANVGVNIAGGAAALLGTGTATLIPNASWTFDISIPLGPVTVIGTAGQPLVCFTG
jgi:hypothetical protein